MRIILAWQGPYSTLKANALDYSKGIYALIDANAGERQASWIPRILCYLGMTYGQTFRDEIQAKLNGDVGKWLKANLKGELIIKVTHIKLVDNDRITEDMVKDIECLLIYHEQPPANIQCIKSYTGRLPIQVMNTGTHAPLPEYIGAKQNPKDKNALLWLPAPKT